MGRKRIWKPKRGQTFVYKVRCGKCVHARGDMMPGEEPARSGGDAPREGYTPGYSEACGVWD
jgi:hypothetical protein